MATHAAVVEVDTDTGSVAVVDYVVVHECGTIVNPTTVDGQIVGGGAQGIGAALFEEIAYGTDGGIGRLRRPDCARSIAHQGDPR